MKLANQITMTRLLFSVVLFVLLSTLDVVEPNPVLLIVSFFLFILVAATDALDGYFARKYGEVSDFGRIADPAVDKITVAGTLVFLCAFEWSRPVLYPWMAVVIISREFIVTGLRSFLESRGTEFAADRSGKLKMIVQCMALPAIFLFKIVQQQFPGVSWAETGSYYLALVLIWAALILTVYSGLDYITRARRILRDAT